MNSKIFLFLALLLATILLISAEATSKDKEDKFNNDDSVETNGVDGSKYSYGWGWGYGGRGPWRGGRHGHHHGWRRGGYGYYCLFGCCSRYTYYGGCRCCYPGELPKANVDVEPHN